LSTKARYNERYLASSCVAFLIYFNFSAKLSVKSKCSQKVSDGAFKELPNDAKFIEICIKTS
jgi:hypothetical protein